MAHMTWGSLTMGIRYDGLWILRVFFKYGGYCQSGTVAFSLSHDDEVPERGSPRPSRPVSRHRRPYVSRSSHHESGRPRLGQSTQ